MSDCSLSLCIPQDTVYRKGKIRRELETGNSFNEIGRKKKRRKGELVGSLGIFIKRLKITASLFI